VTYQSSAPSAYEFDATGKVNGERRSDNYVLANFSSEFKVTKNVAVSGFVKNAFDKRYVTNNRDDEIIDAGAPRTFGMALRYDLLYLPGTAITACRCPAPKSRPF